MNGATLRFWEAQYDVLIGRSRNMMDSPHGWSAWLIPALWYQYLLTGEEEWLRKTMNIMGSCAQVIDSRTGQLRWAFVPDPYREVTMLVVMIAPAVNMADTPVCSLRSGMQPTLRHR